MSAPTIGGVAFPSRALLAPMAGVTDRAYRELCMSMGAGYCVSEMVSSRALSFGSKKSEELMDISDQERPCGIQIFGDSPSCMAEAALAAMQHHPDIIDINMGCPAPKISGSGSGCALMKQPSLCGEIVQAVVRAAEVPVTVKLRKGWDEHSVNAVEVAQICEQAGAAAVTVHGRTRRQFYKPPVDYDIIRQVKQHVGIPVIANGDIDSAAQAQRVLEITGADFVMIGRASLGDPWLFAQINSYLDDPSRPLCQPSLEERLDTMLAHARQMVAYKGEAIALRQARKLVMGYFKGLRGAAELRGAAGKIETIDDLVQLKQRALQLNR